MNKDVKDAIDLLESRKFSLVKYEEWKTEEDGAIKKRWTVIIEEA